MFKNVLLISILFCLLCLNGCATTGLMGTYSQIPQSTPIDVSQKNFPDFGVAKIKSALPPGSVIGGYYDGWARVKWQTYYAQGIVDELTQEHYRNGIRQELENAGYKVSGGGGDLFEEDTTWKARFLVGGRIIKAQYNSFGPLAGNFSEGGVTVDWEIYDKQVRKAIYKKETSGYAKLQGLNLEVCTLSLRNAFRNLLASKEFVNFMEQYVKSPPPELSESKTVEFLKTSPWPKGKMDINEVNKAIIAIKTENGHGSGFIINPEGYAITNYHVIANNNTIDAILKGNKPIQAQVIRTNPEKDLALIKLRGEEYDYLPLTDLSNVKVGMDIYAVGTPIFLGLSNSLSKGIVSGVRKIKDFDITLLQTDASVNPGNSGGPLINMQGEVIGVVALKIADLGVEGLGFAISIDDVKKYLNLQEKTGR